MRARDRIALYLVVGVLVVAPFALGGAARWAICAVGALAAACAASYVTSRRELHAIPPLLVFIGLAVVLTLLQVVPFPSAIVELLSRGKHHLVSENARALGESPPSWLSFSLDPPATLLELAKLGGYFAFAYAALRAAATPARRRWMVMVIAAIGAAMAVTTIVHLAVGAESVYGIYRPREALIRPTLAPFLNHNHLAAFMALCAPMALGLFLSSTERERLAWLAVTLSCVGVGLLAESRGGAIALVIGCLTVGTLTLLQRRRGGTQKTARVKPSDMVAIGVVAMSGLVLIGALTAGGIARDFSGTRLGEVSQSNSKFTVWRETASMLYEFRWTGIGRGSFEEASTRIHDSSTVVFPHVENEYLQAVIDWGFLGAAALALVLIWLATTAARNARTSPWEAGAFAGLVALAVENFTDFSLWMPGIAYPAIAAMAALTWAPVEVVGSARKLLRPARIAVLAVVVILLAVAASPLARETRDETRSLGPTATIRQASAVWARHPASYVAAGMTARALFAERDRRAIAVANRALSLHPTSGDLHRLVAQMLLASQRSEQAQVEYALALRYKPRPEVLDEILAVFPRDEDAVRALPLVPGMVTEWSDRLLQKKRVTLAVAYLQRYLALHPDDARLQLRTADVALSTGDLELAARSAERAHALDSTPAATIMLARIAARKGDPARAQALLRAEIDHPGHPHKHTDHTELLLTLAEVQADQKIYDAARETLRIALTIAEGRQLAQVHRRLGDIEELLGNKHQATWERQRAAELER